MYLDTNNLHGWGMPLKLPGNGLRGEKTSKFDEHFIKDYDQSSNRGYVLEVDVEYPKNLFNLHRDLLFLSETKKIKKCNHLFDSIRQRKLFCSHKSFKTIIKLWIKIKKGRKAV